MSWILNKFVSGDSSIFLKLHSHNSALLSSYYDAIISADICSHSRNLDRRLHRNTHEIKQKNDMSGSHFIAGVAGGISEWFIGHPLDTVRVRIMAGPVNGVPPNGTVSQLITAFSSWEGLKSIYRGSISELMACALGGSLLFGVNNILKRLFMVGPHDEGISSGLLLAAAGTGVIDSTIYKPLEVIKLRQQVSAVSSSFVGTAREMWSESGLRGMYRGLVPTVVREAIGSAAFFAAYELCKERLCLLSNIPRKDASGNIILVSGGMAGIAYVLIAHPFETACVLIQLDNYHKPKYFGMFDVFRKVHQRTGFWGLYTGVGPALARAFPAYAAAFYGYEWALKSIEPMMLAKR